MKDRKNVDEKYKWDLSYLFKDESEIDKAFGRIEYLIQELPKYSGKLSDPNHLHERLTKYEKDFIEIEKLLFYINNMHNVDMADTRILKHSQRASQLLAKLNEADAYFTPQMNKLSTKYLNSLLHDERFKNYENLILDIIKNKPHALNETEEVLLSKLSSFIGNNDKVHSLMLDSEMEFEDAMDRNGKAHKVNNSTIGKLLRSNDRVLRKSSFDARQNGLKKFNKTLAELYINDIETDKAFAKLYKHDSVLDQELFSNDIPREVFEKLIYFTEKNLPLLHEYMKIEKRITGLDDFAYYDLFREEKSTQKTSIEEAQNLVISALAPLGKDYISRVKKKFEEKSIDYLPNKNKNSGGYCLSVYDTKSVILMNYEKDYESVSTLAHEMGHCINAEYYNQYQPYPKAGVPIFLAEIASTVNEILLNQYMLENASKTEKSYYLHRFLEVTRNTIFRQMLFTEFELFAHENIENDQPITYEDLNNEYLTLSKKFYGKNCRIPDNLKYEWSRVPHFYEAYYVYTYASGMITAITIASKLLTEKDFFKKYIKFLSNGLDKKPIEILKEIGIDLLTDEPYETAFAFMAKQLNEYKKLNTTPHTKK